MSVQFIKKIREARNVTRYGLARAIGEPTQSIDHYEEKGKSLRIEVLCKLRKFAGLSWAQMGKMLDDEFMDDKKQN